MSASRNILKAARVAHLYFGVFVAPALLFFAITGALQTFQLHETHRGSDYKPPRWAVVLGQLHKKQTIVLPPPRPSAAAGAEAPKPKKILETPAVSIPAAPTTPTPAAQVKHNLLPMKIFFLVVSIGLCLSTFTGLYMAYMYTRNKVAVSAFLAAGIVVPLFLLWF